MSSWHDANHPIWPTIRIVVTLVALTAVLWMNASHFDDTELKTIITMFLAFAGIEGITNAATRRNSA